MEESTSLHTECAHKPHPAVLNQFSRTELLLGEDNMQRLFNARVAVFGIGGVGGYTVEALARVGVGTLDLIDDDRICLTNLNRQIFATRKSVFWRLTRRRWSTHIRHFICRILQISLIFPSMITW